MTWQITQRIILSLLLVTLSMWLVIPTAGAQTPDLDAIDAFIEAQMHKHALPGVAIAITQGDEILYLQGYGKAGRNREMTAQTPLYIGSVSKSFTGLAVMQLVAQDKIDLDAPVRTYLPWFEVADAAASREMTVRHLAHHVSGLSDAGFDTVLPPDISREEAVRRLRIAHLTAPLGQTAQYFNMNYTTLSLIVEKVTGQSYEEYVAEHIFAPLEMERSFTSPDEAQAHGLAQGYSRFLGILTPRQQVFRPAELGAGYLMSTAEDMAHFVIAQNNDGRYGETNVLSPAGVAQMHTAGDYEGFDYNMGWHIDERDGLVQISHGGANECFKTELFMYPERGLGIVILMNQGYLVDAFISQPQLTAGIVARALGNSEPTSNAEASPGPSMQVIGAGMLIGFLLTAGFMLRSALKLPAWTREVAAMAPRKRAWDIASHFIIPTIIIAVGMWQAAQLFGDRFNLAVIGQVMVTRIPDIFTWLLVGTLPDYAQGLFKVGWLLRHRE